MSASAITDRRPAAEAPEAAASDSHGAGDSHTQRAAKRQLSQIRSGEGAGAIARPVKRIRTTKNQVHVTLQLPEGAASGTYDVQIILERPETPPSIILSEEYEGKESDVTLRFDGNREIQLHREVLAKSSSYFEGLFSSRWRATQEKKIFALLNTDFDHARQVIQYMYTDTLPITLDVFPWIHDFAEKWGMDVLSERCADFINQFFHPDRWNNLLPHHEIYEEVIIDYFAANAASLFKRDEFTQLPPDLFGKILAHPELNLSHEKTKIKALYKWARANCPAGMPLKDYIKTVSANGKRLIEGVHFNKCSGDSVIKIFGRDDIFTVQEIYQLLGAAERYLHNEQLKPKTHLRAPKIRSYTDVSSERHYNSSKTTCAWRTEPEFKGINTSTPFETVYGPGKFEYSLQCEYRDEQLLFSIVPVRGLDALDRVKIQLTLINHADLRRNIQITAHGVEEGLSVISKEELTNPDQSWLRDGKFYLVADVSVVDE